MTNRAEIRISLELKPFPIPYPAVKRDDGENFGYKSLIDDPESIDEIPELFNEPAIKKFVALINAPGRTFETVRIVHWFDTSESGTSQSICLGFKFRDRTLFADYSNCLQFAGHMLQQAVSGNIVLDIPPLLEIQPAYLIQENASGWIMDIYLSGIGVCEDAARLRLSQVLNSVCTLLCIEA
jgi:hypothetical protein